jgi:hypothetical protein
VFLNNAVTHRQSQAGAVAGRLGGKKRIENLVADGGIDALAVIPDFDFKMFSDADQAVETLIRPGPSMA